MNIRSVLCCVAHWVYQDHPTVMRGSSHSSAPMKHAAMLSRKRSCTGFICCQPSIKTAKVSVSTLEGAMNKRRSTNSVEFLQSHFGQGDDRSDDSPGSEYILSPTMCQPHIAGQNGRNTCTIIAAYVCKQFLSTKTITTTRVFLF